MTLRIICTCGSDVFQVFKSEVIKTEEQKKHEKELNAFEKRCGFRSWYMDKLEDGKMYAYRKNIFGKIVDKLLIPDKLVDNTEIIKVNCNHCGEEHVLFDSRFHGYDSIEVTYSVKESTYKFIQKRFNRFESDCVQIEISLSNFGSLSEFIDAYGEEVDNEFYANAFGWISIIGLSPIKNGKVTILDKEMR